MATPIRFTETEKWCSKCQEWRNRDNFHSNKSTASSLSTYCKKHSCENAKQRRDPSHSRNYLYGLTSERYQQMYEDQKGKCKIKSCPRPIAATDHIHGTKTIRGLLCKQCNMALGLMMDSPLQLKDAADYLETFNGQQHNPITSNS